MQYNDIINNGTLVYKSQAGDKKLREWPVKETLCAVRFYKTEELSELELVLLRLISSLESNKITKEDIALTLGFDVAEKTFGNKRFYHDQAEISLFSHMIDSIFKWNLAVEESDSVDQCSEENSESEDSEENNGEFSAKKEAIKYIRLTRLGNKALEMNCKFSFYEGEKCLLENVNKSELSIDTVDFPFYTELGFFSEIKDVKAVTDIDPDKINIDYADNLINRINLQSNKTTNVFEAKTTTLSKRKDPKSVDVCLYQLNEDFYPIILINDKVSVAATDILYREQNAYLLNKKIKKALYSKLINNADSTINYNEIRYFEDEIEQDEFNFIVRDSRTDWGDIDTYNYIIHNELCNNNNWDYISKCCPEDIIIQHIGEPCSKFDMITLSRRLPISFIIESYAKYAWEMSVVLSRNDITKQQAQELMLCDVNTNIEWDWEIVKPFLDVNFVVNNIDHLNIDFYNLTSWLPSCNQNLIVKYCHKRWNWSYFAKEADVNLVIQNISALQDHIAVYIETILDKIFSNNNLIKSVVTNNEFAEVVKSIKGKGLLISYNLCTKVNYIWSDELIEYLEKCNLLIWNTSGFIIGFAQYPYIEWTTEFFKKYHVKIDSASDYTYISKHIKDISLITEYPDFSWDWSGLSGNQNFADSEDLLNIGQDKVLYSEWMKHSSTVFTSEFFASHIQWMKSEENAAFVSSIVNDYDIVMKFLDFPWNWNKLAGNKTIATDERFCALLNAHTDAITSWLNATSSDLIERYFDTLGLSVYINTFAEIISTENSRFINNIWDRLSSNLSINFIFHHLSEKWNKVIISQRLIPLLEESPGSLDNCKSALDWSVLSKNFAVSFIEEHISNYVDYWNWSVLTNRVAPAFLRAHFKDYLSFWDKDTAISRITPLLDENDLNDPELDSVWDWYLLSGLVTDKVLLNILSSKADYLDWNIVSSRISNMEDMDFGLLLKSTPNLTDHLDWNILNENMALSEILKWKDLQNAVWDWTIITKRFDTSFIVDNLAQYAPYWDWDVILKEKIHRTYVMDNLKHIKDSIVDLETDTKELCWKRITSLYSPADLLELSEKYNPTDGYEWNYSYIYKAIHNLDDFVSKEHSYVDYKALSASQVANNMFIYDSDTYVFRTWKAIIKSKLNDGKYNWDFSELTKLDSIQQKNDVFYELQPERWDWNYISQFGICLLPAHNGKYIRKYRDRLNFKLISTRDDINIDDNMVSSFIEENWDWQALSSNAGTNITFDFIFNNREKEWDWNALSKNSTIKWNDAKLHEILKDPVIKAAISWDDVVAKRELHIDDSLIKLMDGIDINWFELSSNPSFSPSIKNLKRAIEEDAKINWIALSKNQNIDLSFAREYKDFLDWRILTSNKKVINIQEEKILDEFGEFLDWSYISDHIELTNQILVKYRDSLIWKSINNRFNYNQFDLSVIDNINDKIDWTKLSSSSILFTENFMHQYRNRIDWFAFSKNKSVDFTADLYRDFIPELNRVKFVETLSKIESTNGYSKLKVYHFSHMFNAIEIIKNRKIMSRNKAEETKALKYDAAGAVVHRTNKAHPYARFYYRPKSPTQFYNECLGWDDSLTRWNKSYYPQACNLHLPKCPMPVFFEFDIREIIAKMPSKCYYSSGNLQTNFASVYKVDSEPSMLRTSYLYNDISDAFNMAKQDGGFDHALHHMYMGHIKEQSQQEFLVLDEFDFSCLDSFKIYCYDEFQKNLLVQYLGDDEIIDKIEVNYSIYSHKNRSLDMSENEDSITISSNYDLNGCAYILVKGGAIINKGAIKNFISSGAIIYPSVTFDKKNPPSEIYLMDPNPRADTKEWLIYKS